MNNTAPNNQDKLADFQAAEIKPRFEVHHDGVFYIGIMADKHGGVTEKPPVKLSDPIHIIGRGIDNTGSHYRVIQWRDNVTRETKTAALDMADIGQNWQVLQRRGIIVIAGRRSRELLSNYLQTEGATTPYTVTDKAGWIDGAYILPSGEILTDKQQQGRPHIIYNGDTSQAAAYAVSGSLTEWQNQIAAYAAQNSRLCLALGTALAAPLLHIIGEQNGGFHLYGDSSDGKTTAALVGLSVWGNPAMLKMAWRGTSQGFSNAALARNDGFMVLDEIGEADTRTIGQTAYSVINGKSKIQGAKDGGNRAAHEWRILIFSTGEYSMPSYVERNGQRWEAGQAIRLPSIPASTQFGIYEHLHGHTSGAALSDHLQNAITEQFGTAGRAWITHIQTMAPERIKEAANTFLSMLPPMSGQPARVARRFALTAAALELAAPITGLAAGIGMAGIKKCFDDWITREGLGKREDKTIIENAIGWFQTNAYNRFDNLSFESAGYAQNLAGYREISHQNGEHTDFYMIPAIFKNEICQGYDVLKVCEVLHSIDWLQKHGKRWQKQKRVNGEMQRFYQFYGMTPKNYTPDNETDDTDE